MKKILSILAIAAVMVACSKEDSTTDVAPATYTLTGYSSLDTRTEFGTPNEETKKIPFLWSDGDMVWIDGTRSSALKCSTPVASATFSVTSEPKDGDVVYYNMNAKLGPNANIADVRASQSTANSLGVNGDFGYATVENGAFRLNHATSYLWFDIEALPEGYALKSISFNAGDAIVAGKAKWNGSAFGTPTNDSSIIDLAVEEDTEMITMVVLPTEIESATITYELSNGTKTMTTTQTLGGKTLASGTTYKISVNINATDIYELRVLTFEDGDWKYDIGGETSYYLDYADYWSGREITTWSDLIDDPQYGGPLLYGDFMSTTYYWYDNNNTELYHMFPDVNGYYCYWGGGHAISNYWGAGYADEDRDKHIANYYGEDYVSNNQGYDSSLGWFCVQLMTPVKAHSGDNFAVHFGYGDFFNTVMGLPEWTFGDGEARVIDHMWVTNTNYTLNQLYNGVKSEAGNTFGGSWEGLTEDAWLKIVAAGYENVDDDEPTETVEFYLVKGFDVVEDWKKWDLSGLGKVAKVKFNFEYSDEMGGKYGFTIPGYFAYDDVAVRF